MPLPTYEVAISFGASSLINVTQWVQSISINRGISRSLDDYSAGSISITFVNNSRIFDPLNTSSPLWYAAGGYTLVQPAGFVRVRSNNIRRFTGKIQDWDFTYDESGLDGQATLTALDYINDLGNASFTEEYLAAKPDLVQLTGDKIFSSMNDLGLTAPVIRQDGDTIIGFDNNQVGDNVLSYLQNVARSEPADFYSNASAVMVFKDRSFTDYTWASTNSRQNRVAYPSTATWYGLDEYDNNTTNSGWVNGTTLSAITPFIGGGSVNRAGTGLPLDPANGTVLFEYADYNPDVYAYLGNSYVFGGYVRGYVGTINVGYNLLDINGYLVGGTSFSVSPASTATWTNIMRVVSTTDPAEVVSKIYLFAYIDAGTAYPSVRLYGSNWKVEAGSAFTNYFDGNYNPDENSTYVKYAVGWAGEAYQSMSGQVTSVASTATTTNAITFADINSQGASFGNGTGIPFTDLNIVYGSEQLYTQVQVVGANATAIANDTAGQTNYGLRSYAQTDNLTTSTTRPTNIASEFLAEFRLPEYRAEQLTVALESLTTAQQNILLGLDLRDVVRVCFKPSNLGNVVDKFYQILSINTDCNVEQDTITFTVASLENMPFRLDSQYLGILDTDTLA
jgi:hypothetical protein